MGSKKRLSRSALLALAEEIQRDATLDPTVRSRLSWAIRRDFEGHPGMGILEEEVRAAAWRLLWSLAGLGAGLQDAGEVYLRADPGVAVLGDLRPGGFRPRPGRGVH